MQRTDLTHSAAAIVQGHQRAQDLIEQSIAVAGSPLAAHAYIRRFDDQARAVAQASDAARASGIPLPALAGLAVSIKDLFDVQGQPTTAGSRTLDDAAPASVDCSVVARLRAAGAALTGHTNLSEFAYSGVGINPHFGTPANAATATLCPLPRVPGGSTSGGAVTVASGAAWAALGSDTGGSIRIPAALQGLVGFKNSQALTPLDRTIPLSSTLDTACAITLSVRDARLLHGILAARQPGHTGRPLSAWRLGLPLSLMLDDLEPAVAQAFEQALSVLRRQGAQIVDLPLRELAEMTEMLAQGGFSAAESWAWHRQRLARRGADYDPRVAARIRRGEAVSAADYIDLHARRRDWIARMGAQMQGFDALLSPTVPLIAPPIAPLLQDDAAFARTNLALLRNCAPVNQFDGCALSLPCQAPGQMPVGLMIWGPAQRDDSVLEIGALVEACLVSAISNA